MCASFATQLNDDDCSGGTSHILHICIQIIICLQFQKRQEARVYAHISLVYNFILSIWDTCLLFTLSAISEKNVYKHIVSIWHIRTFLFLFSVEKKIIFFPTFPRTCTNLCVCAMRWRAWKFLMYPSERSAHKIYITNMFIVTFRLTYMMMMMMWRSCSSCHHFFFWRHNY